MEKSAPPPFQAMVQQVSTVFGTACLAQLHDEAVLGGHDRLHVEQRTHGAGRSRQTTATHQILQRLEQADNHHAVAHGLDRRRDLERTTALVHQAQRMLGSHALAPG